MGRALALARRALGRTSPNPCVGAVLVRGGRVIGEGWHRKAGRPHAEIEALRAARRAGEPTQGATLYVTLEPCSTHGRTPPCTEAILAAGIRRVVAGAVDPNPRHAGRAFALLRRSGVTVNVGILAGECADLIRPFARWVVSGRPWVVAKLAVTLDGRYSRPRGASPWITGTAARQAGHALRLLSDAIIVGAETVRRDNPRLTVRLGGDSRGKVQPLRVVLTRSRDLPPSAQVFTDAHRERTILLDGTPRAVVRELGHQGVTHVLVEGGGCVVESFLKADVVDEIAFFVAPDCHADATPAFDYLGHASRFATGLEVVQVGRDVMIRGRREVSNGKPAPRRARGG
jgi:diaminohydroxyphosphoribosylaminopyrimidine deaminase/5-amino-6-(5-phosphoribosylamino)uracil reductase